MSASIERGNTQDGVNVEVIRSLQRIYPDSTASFSILDLPAGQGSFLRAVRSYFKNSQIKGVDLFADPYPDIAPHFTRGSSANWDFAENKKFEVISCISGVMCFDNVNHLFEQASSHLSTGGHFMVTNDNILTVRDRLSFLFLGRIRRFRKIYRVDEGNWNVMLIQALWKLYRSHGFQVESVTYTSRRPEDHLLWPLAVLIYPFEFLSLCFTKSEMPLRERIQLFPPLALISRHYVMVGKKK